MRVGLVIYGSLKTLSGGYLYDRVLVEYLRAQGDQVEVISLPDRSYPGRLAGNLFRPRSVGKAQLPLDILLQDELCHPSLIWWNRKLKGSDGVPVISIVHHLLTSEPGHHLWLAPLYRRVELAYLRSVDGFIFNSETTRKVVENAVGQDLDSVVSQPGADRLNPSVSDEEIIARSRTDGPLRILYLGNVIPRKGLDVLMDALLRLSENAWELTVVGSLEMDRDYSAIVKQMVGIGGFEGRIRFTGPLEDIQLVREMENHHLMALPSYYEGYGIAYLEAMGFGMPVIASDAGAAPEIITAGVDGFLIPPGDSAALADLIEGLMADRPRLAQMGCAARRRYLASPRWAESMEKIRSFLRNVMDRRGLNGWGSRLSTGGENE
jgi:glycosyltransferase involved in cell wall biosynthesis